MKFILIFLSCTTLVFPVKAVTTKMFKVLDTCARYRLGEINVNEAMEKLKLKTNNASLIESKDIVKKYCSVFTPNQKIEY